MSQGQELLTVLIFLEFFEVLWQKGDTFQKYIKNLFSHYNKGVLFFVLLHPTFYFVIFSQIYLSNYGFLASCITVLKALDIATKISLMDKLYKQQDTGFFQIFLKENYKIPLYFKFIGPVLYITLFYLAFS